MDKKQLEKEFRKIIKNVDNLEMEEKIETINELRKIISEISPFKNEPVDCIQWIHSEKVIGNEYNPNKVAPPEMRLLHLSIKEDGFTQPIVTYKDKDKDKDIEQHIIVDGFHRNRVGKEYKDINERIKKYLPIVTIDKTITERMASTIRHNRARGTHEIQGMSEIVAELHFKGISDKKIAEQLGMGKDEVLKLKQFTGLGDLFKNKKFSKAWE